MAAKRDFYEILGISKNATPEEIKRAYRAKAKQYHPDVSKEKDAEARFKEVQEAYEILSDPQKKELYDQYGHDAFTNQSGGPGFGGFDKDIFSQIFESVFGGGFSSGFGSDFYEQGPKKGRSLRAEVTIDFTEAIFGCEKEIKIKVLSQCKKCNGTGADDPHDLEVCSECRGSGRVRKTANTLFGRSIVETVCSKCRGRGKTVKTRCTNCRGEGRTEEQQVIKFRIPQGIDDGQMLTLRGKGEAGLDGGINGDLYIKVNVREHEIYERDELDIYLILPCTFSELALGIKREIPTLYGKVLLSIPAGTQTGSKFKLPGKGVKFSQTNRQGDMFVIVKAITPLKPSKEERELYQKLKDKEVKKEAVFTLFDKYLK